MKLFTYCNSCKGEIPIKSYASSKPELAMDMGEKFNINCVHCGVNMEKQVNDVWAKPNKIIILVGWLVAIIVTIALWKISLIGSVSVAIPLLVWQHQSKAVHAFNAHKRR